MATSADGFREQLRRAGIWDDKPLHGVLVTVHEAAVCAREAVGSARALTPEGEADLIRRVSAEAAQGAERQAQRLLLRFNTGLAIQVALVLVLVGLAGLWAGYRSAETGSRSPSGRLRPPSRTALRAPRLGSG